MRIDVEIDLGGERQHEMSVKFFGSDCAVNDFEMDLVKFANQWVLDRQQRKQTVKNAKGPCGCGEAKAGETKKNA